ncbi:hypothetical protein E2562_020784 [Oryza meyeriana var. granulata]|uniref:Uncharacterized protein n=1 Tax=Oryza meyeriana var. granulata TaxID=110450 RepID=A0A6G1CHC4_9ORYZ|nr:hypothetical protein E2562_020784 [Oryza meyeriana var. granulata]
MSVCVASKMMNSFYSSIAHGLDALHRSLDGEVAFMSTPFLQQAAALLRSLHSQLLHLVQRLHLPPGESWLDEYMDETSRLWDACQLVRAGASALDAYCASAARALHDCRCVLLSHHLVPSSTITTHAARHAARAINAPRRHAAGLLQENRALADARLDPASLLLDHRSPLDFKLNAFNGFRGVLYALRNATSFLLAILVSATVSCLPDQLCCGPLPATAATAAGYVSSMARLRQRVAEEMDVIGDVHSGGIMMYEFRQARAGIENLKAELDRVVATGYGDPEEMAERAEHIKGWVAMLRSGAESVIAELDDFFDDIVEGRKMLSDLCSHR